MPTSRWARRRPPGSVRSRGPHRRVAALSAFGCRVTPSTRRRRHRSPLDRAPRPRRPPGRPGSARRRSRRSGGERDEITIQDRGTRIAPSVPRQEAHVVLEEVADLVDAVADHGDPSRPKADAYPCHSSGSMPTARNTAGRHAHPPARSSRCASTRGTRHPDKTRSAPPPRSDARCTGRSRAEPGLDRVVVEQAADERLDRPDKVAT